MAKSQKQIDDDAAAAEELAARVEADQAAANKAAAEEAERQEAEAQALRDAEPPAPEGSVTVDVRSNLALATGEILVVGQEGVTVPDTAEVRALIAAEHLTEQETKARKGSSDKD